jgi:hypothetical protein
LERAVEAMPANVRVEELPGLLKRYKEGVPGWELKEADFPGLIGDAKVIPRQDLLDRVRERSPVFTHGEVVLGGRPIVQASLDPTNESLKWLRSEYPNQEFIQRQRRTPIFDSEALPLGQYDSAAHGLPKYEDYGHGGSDYTEVLLVQPGAGKAQFGSHWSDKERDAVAHARFDTHGDALRINELQSDLGIHNRKMREANQNLIGDDAETIAMKDRRESDDSYIARMREMGYGVQRAYGGGWTITSAANTLPFPLEDAWSDLLIKRLALEAARQGHRAIEIASPRAIADKVGGNIENYEHFYGKVVPGAIERLGRKMGGVVEDPSGIAVIDKTPRPDWPGREAIRETIMSTPTSRGTDYAGGQFWRNYSEMMHANLSPLDSDRVYQEFGGWGNYGRTQEQAADDMYLRLTKVGYSPQEAQAITSRALMEAPHAATQQAAYVNQKIYEHLTPRPSAATSRRYLMSDEMRKRILTQGIGASLLAPMAMEGEE